MNEINSKITNKLRYLPTASTIIAYIKTNMMKRSFSDVIFPKIVTQVTAIVDSLDNGIEI